MSDSKTVNASAVDHQIPDLTTDCVIVGTGPAGGALAAFLSSYGINGIIISREKSTATTPRAHLTNMAAMECFRDIDLEEQLRRLSLFKTGDVRWSSSMAGAEYARSYAFGNGPLSEGRYGIASPCDPVDLPQDKLEPQLINYAATHGFTCRFETEYVSFEEKKDDGGVVDITVHDKVFERTYKIRSKFLFGADGGRSQIANDLQLSFTKNQGGGLAWSVLIKADMTHLMDSRRGSLHWIYQPEIEHPDFAWIGFPRMVREYDQWLIIFFPVPGYENTAQPSKEDWLKRVNQFIGDSSVKAEILDITKWRVNETYANEYSKGRVFCLGDAVHRHPPASGLGSNTCIQDGFNLAWKIVYVLKGIAGMDLLHSYNTERQPVGRQVVEHANRGVRHHFPIWQAMGLLGSTPAERAKGLALLSEDSETGLQQRRAFQAAIEGTVGEYQSLGVEMNQRYVSNAVYQADQGAPPQFTEDVILSYQPTTYPGARVPHAWLNSTIPSKPKSTIDITGLRRFTLLTGIGGQAWKDAVVSVSGTLNIPIVAISIGFRQDFEDIYFQWAKLREVEESGCVLVRPDRVVAWRSNTVQKDCEGLLLGVMRNILAL
ncbi:FAD binding domain-containing protein [Xylogone sp. PMI_703]|nr:FAD binding domain-containing protein [Xylogone sp. PMI_703]